jgi:anti-sigma regulatory factor (Ser/Thr protein kinase)
VITEKDEIERLASATIHLWTLDSLADMDGLPDEVVRQSMTQGMDERRAYEFLGCVVEAAGNAVKHAPSGKASLSRLDDSLIFIVSDTGPGIGTMALPDVALTRGYSTTGTLGMGYKLMLRFADKVYLATGPDGTVVGIQMSIDRDDA